MTRLTKLNWFVAQYKPNSFFLAKKNLERQGLKTFLPLIEMTSRKNALFSTEKKPLFPGYIFISFNEKEFKWSAINNTIGLTRLLVKGNLPQIVPKSFITSLKSRCSGEGILLKNPTLEIGEKVQVLKGPFSSMIGSIETITPENRVSLLFEILGRQTKITLSKSDVFNFK